MAPAMSTMGPARSMPRFMSFSPEIRLMIWEFAIQNPNLLPLAHFFDFPNDTTQKLWQDIGPTPGYSKLVDRCSRHQQDMGEPSAEDPWYANDSGLYYACEESRDALIKFWAQKAGVSMIQMNQSLYRAVGFGLDGSKFYLTMRPREDLICAPSPWDVERARSQVGLFSTNVGNVAFIYDTAWDNGDIYLAHHVLPDGTAALGNPVAAMDFFRHISCRSFCEVTDWMIRKPSGVNLWFIDYHIKPTLEFHMDKIPEGRIVFQGRLHMFIEVTMEDVRSSGLWEYSLPREHMRFWQCIRQASTYVQDRQRHLRLRDVSEALPRALACVSTRALK